MYSFSNISKSFKDARVLTNVSINMNQGEIYGLLGSNGAGKTTTMNILAGLTRPSWGKCSFEGRTIEIGDFPNMISLGYMMEEPIFYGWMTGLENLSLYCSTKHGKDKLLRDLDRVGMLKACNKRTSSYSRGMKQRLGIACALVDDPDFLILDEPTSALDPEGRKDILDLISDLSVRGKSIILSTHILSDAEKVCNKVGIIRNGKTIVEDSMTNLLNKHLSQIYSIITENMIGEDILDMLIQKNMIHEFSTRGLDTWITVNKNSNINDILSLLIENNINISEVMKKKKSLENIFIERTGEKDETSAA